MHCRKFMSRKKMPFLNQFSYSWFAIQKSRGILLKKLFCISQLQLFFFNIGILKYPMGNKTDNFKFLCSQKKFHLIKFNFKMAFF